MLSSVLRSDRAVEVNIAIMRTFVQLRRLMDGNADLARKIESLEKKYDEKFAAVFAAIKQSTAGRSPSSPTDEVAVSADGRTRRGEATDLCLLPFSPQLLNCPSAFQFSASQLFWNLPTFFSLPPFAFRPSQSAFPYFSFLLSLARRSLGEGGYFLL